MAMRYRLTLNTKWHRPRKRKIWLVVIVNYGRQSRYFSVLHDIGKAKAEVRYHDNGLELSLPKKAGTPGGKQLEVL
jgi:hypothetical protein